MSKDIKSSYFALVDKCNGFEVKGKNMLYTSANGYMFSLINKNDQLGIRFSEKKKKEYMEKYETDDFISYAAIMKGYILITNAMWEDEENLIKLLNESYTYVSSLKPK